MSLTLSRALPTSHPGTLFAAGFLLISALLGVENPVESRQDPKPTVRVEQTKAASCTVCHPGEMASLARSVHAKLVTDLEPSLRDNSCLECHENGLAHQENSKSKDPKHAPGDGLSSCVRCHEQIRPSRVQALMASHPSKREARDSIAELRALVAADGPRLPADERMLPPVSDLDERALAERLRFEGLIRAGWRFVDVDGNERLFDKDWNLDAGARLSAIELRGLRGEDELFGIEGGGFEDRSMWLRADTGRALLDDVSAKGGWRRTRWQYDADDDWASFSNKRDRGDAAVELDLEDVRLELAWERLSLDERSLASSIGDRNASPLAPATGIPVDRRFVSDRIFVTSEFDLGSRDDRSGVLALELGWETTRQLDELRYSRPSPNATSITESEASQSRTSRRGPDASLRLALGEDGGRELRAVAFGLDHDVRIFEEGTLQAFDTSLYTLNTLGNGAGSRRFLSLGIEAAEPVWDDGRVLLELGWRDHRDLLSLELFETTIRPPVNTVVRTLQESRVRSTEHEIRVGLEQSFFDRALTVEAAYRWLEQDLELPDLVALDSDYRAGTIRTHGPELEADWRVTDDWRVRGVFRWAGTDDLLPNETQPEVGQFAKLRIRRRFENDGHLEFWAKWRRGENDVASTEIDSQSYGVGWGCTPWETARLTGRLGFSRIRSQTLTNFYFAPSITPVPTFVRYRGDSFLADVALETDLGDHLRSTTTGSIARTDGSLDTLFWRLDEDLRYRIDDAWSVGLRASFFEYDGDTISGRGEGYDARLAFVYAELRF